MIPTVTATIGTLAMLWMSPIAMPQEIALADWAPKVGDSLVVDTSTNVGYLVRGDGRAYTTFPVITGQQRWVSYIGRSYNAATPSDAWVVKSRHVKGDRITFGPTGRFLRLYRNGTEYTSYGIHEHRSEKRMFSEKSRYQSMGCIIVESTVLDVLEQAYELNGASLDVVTL